MARKSCTLLGVPHQWKKMTEWYSPWSTQEAGAYWLCVVCGTRAEEEPPRPAQLVAPQMKCNQCTKPAMFAIPAEGGTVPLCLDCKIKFNRMLQDQTRELERSHNFIMDLWDEATGLPGIGPRYPAVAPPVQIGEVRLHNIKIDHSTIGVLNTGNLEMVDSAVTVLRGESAEGARVAEAVLALTQAVLASNLSTAAKNEAVELLGGVAAEASAPKEKRRSAMARALIDRLAVIVTNGAALVDLWGRVKPILDAMFPG